MTDPTTTFNRLRPRLQGIAYRMLGSVAEADFRRHANGCHWVPNWLIGCKWT